MVKPSRYTLVFVGLALLGTVVIGVGMWKIAQQPPHPTITVEFGDFSDEVASEAAITPAAGRASNVSYDLVNNHCSIDECLFNIGNSNYPLGSAVIKGYYSPVERSAWGETKKCDSFTIVEGSKEFIRAMVDLVDGGNSVHSKNELNQPVINLGLDLLSQTEKQSILDSTENNQVELIILNDSPKGIGVPACHQDVIVLREK